MPPKEVKVRYRKSASLAMAGGVFLAVSFAALLRVPFLEDVESRTLDLRFQVQGERKPDVPVVIVAIDDRSLAEVGRWPWPRAVQADLVERLRAAGARYVFLDIFYPEPEKDRTAEALREVERLLGASPREGEETAELRVFRERLRQDLARLSRRESGDARLSRALREAGNVLLPVVVEIGEEGRSPAFESLNAAPAEILGRPEPRDFLVAPSLILSIPEIQKSALDAGHIRVFPDADGIVRHYPVAVAYGGSLVPHVSLQIARRMLGDGSEPVRVAPGRFALLPDRKIPLQSRWAMAFIDYVGGKDAFPWVSAADVLAGRAGRRELEGAVALVGVTAEGLYDLRPTPFTRANPGIVVNANILENALTGRFKRLAPEYVKHLIILLFALLPWLWVPRFSPVQGAFVYAGAVAAFAAGAALAFTHGALVVNVTYPFLALTGSTAVLTVYKLRTEVRHSRYLKQMFQSMVAPSVVEEILRLPKGIELGGEERELTVLFSDVRGFTTYSERHSPREVVEVLNEYLTQMTQLVFQTEGTLDKYIGDAIMAFWGSPTAQKDHAYRACSTALGMVDLLQSVLHPKWELEGREKLQIGVGLNTGPMVVGFVGSEHVKNYTLIGDNVNLASRLEGVTKEYGVPIVVGEATYLQVKEDMLCRELDLIRVKGKDRPIRIYELVDHRLKAAGMRETKTRLFGEALGHYRGQRWEEARRAFRSCLELDPHDGPSRVFLERVERLQDTPLPPDWDGVFTMKSK